MQAPADVSEDIVSVQRQLEALKFASRAGEERLTWRLMQALTLLYMRAGGAGQAGPLLAQALEQAGGYEASHASLLRSAVHMQCYL